MTLGIGNLWMLFALFALAIPILLHLLQRRRFDTLDWGAMQFLPDSEAAQRKRWIDEIILMLLRMGMIALIVIALATPFSTSAWLAPLGDRGTRDIVLVFDGSYSMDMRLPGQATPWEEAIAWAKKRVAEASRGERFAVMIARQPPVFVAESFDIGADFDTMPTPRGNPDIPLALAEAWRHLQTHSKAADKEIIVLTDRQQFGWADHGTLSALDNLGSQWHAETQRARSDGTTVPSLQVVTVGPALPKGTAENYALAPLATSRRVARLGQKVTFQSALHLDGPSLVPKAGLGTKRPHKVKASVDGQEIHELPLPDAVELKQGQIPLSFQHRFDKEGTYLVSLAAEVDAAHDVLAADNVQHLIIEVVKDLPILLVEGDKSLSAESSSFFLQRALATGKKSPPAIGYHDLKTLDAYKPAVIVLADVPRLEPSQLEVIERFVADGGGLLVVVGDRMAKERAFCNDQLYRDGHGWLPARLGEVGAAKDGVQPEPRSFQHPALELFRAGSDATLAGVRFTQWCKVELEANGRATPIALLSNGEPLLIEKAYKRGRVILCTVPLDRRWDSTLPNTSEYPILVHELTYYLAGIRNASGPLERGVPIRVASSPSKQLFVTTPELAKKTIDVNHWPWTYANTGAVGVYQVNLHGDERRVHVVSPELRESNLARCTEADWSKVRGRLPIVWNAEPEQAPSVGETQPNRQDLWWLLLLGVIALLCTEVWMTRRMVVARGR